MKQLMFVAIGGALGSVARWLLSGVILHHTAAWRFPLGTFVVNLVGCLIVGVLAGMVVKLEWFSPDARLLLFTGLAGGFTTFSAFGLETFYLLRRHEYAIAGAYSVLSVVCGITALAIGFSTVRGNA